MSNGDDKDPLDRLNRPITADWGKWKGGKDIEGPVPGKTRGKYVKPPPGGGGGGGGGGGEGTDYNLPIGDEDGDGGGYTLTFAQTSAGQRLAAALAIETERFSGAERLKLEATLHSLAMDLLPPEDVETAMRQVRRGELVKSKLAFQAVLQNLSDASEHAERRADLALAEENERNTLRDARARITVDMVGRDVGRAIIFALSGGEDA